MRNLISRDAGRSQWMKDSSAFMRKYGIDEAVTGFAMGMAIYMQANARGGWESARNSDAERKTLFRGERSSMTPDMVFKNGFISKGSGDNSLAHITSNTTPGNFVSTSINKGVAQDFAGENGYVYEISTSNYIDVNRVLGANSPYPEQMEFSIPGGISPSQIKGAWTTTGEFIQNPNYIGR
jgi:hypothetical protein